MVKCKRSPGRVIHRLPQADQSTRSIVAPGVVRVFPHFVAGAREPA